MIGHKATFSQMYINNSKSTYMLFNSYLMKMHSFRPLSKQLYPERPAENLPPFFPPPSTSILFLESHFLHTFTHTAPLTIALLTPADLVGVFLTNLAKDFSQPADIKTSQRRHFSPKTLNSNSNQKLNFWSVLK